MFCNTCDLEIKHSLHKCPFCGGALSDEPLFHDDIKPQPHEFPKIKLREPEVIKPEVHDGIELEISEHIIESTFYQEPTQPDVKQDADIIMFVSEDDVSASVDDITPDDSENETDPVAFVSFGQLETAGNDESETMNRPLPIRRVLIPLVIIAAVVFGVVLLSSLFRFSLAEAMAALNGDIKTRVRSSFFILAEPIGKCLENGEITAFISYNDEYGGSVSGSASYASNREISAHSISLLGDIYGTSVDAEFFINRDYFALGSSLLGNYYGINFNSFVEDFAVFVSKSGIVNTSSDDYADIVNMINYLFNGRDKLNLPADDVREINLILSDFIAGLPSAETREKMTIGEENLTAAVLTYSVTMVDLSNLGYKLLDYASSDDNIRSLLSAYLQYQGSANYYENDIYEKAQGNKSTVQSVGNLSPIPVDESVDALLDELAATLKTLESNCTGDISVRFISSKGRICAYTLSSALNIDGAPLKFGMILDFGQSIYDDWIFDFYIKDSDMEYNFHTVWSYADNGGIAKNDVVFTADFGTSTDSVALHTQLEKSTGAFSISLRDNSDKAVMNLSGTLTHSDEGFSLQLNTTPELSFKIIGTTKSAIAVPRFVNLDMWDIETLRIFSKALSNTYNDIYSFQAPEFKSSDEKLIVKGKN